MFRPPRIVIFGKLAGAGAPAKKYPSLVNIYNFNKSN